MLDGELAGALDGPGLSDLAGSPRDHRAGRDCAAELQAASEGVAREVLKHHMIAFVPTFQDNVPDFDAKLRYSPVNILPGLCCPDQEKTIDLN